MRQPSTPHDAAKEAQKLINSNASLRQALNSPDAQQILKVLQSKDANRLLAAAQSALKGDPVPSVGSWRSCPKMLTQERPWTG